MANFYKNKVWVATFIFLGGLGLTLWLWKNKAPSQEQFEELIDQLQDKNCAWSLDSNKRRYSQDQLSRDCTRSSLPFRRIFRGSYACRMSALYCIERTGRGSEALPIVLKSLKAPPAANDLTSSGQKDFERMALWFIADHGSKEDLEFLRDLLSREKDESLAVEIISAISVLGSGLGVDVPEIGAVCDKGSKELLRQCLLALSKISGRSKINPKILNSLNSSDPSVKEIALEALGISESPEAHNILLDELKNSSQLSESLARAISELLRKNLGDPVLIVDALSRVPKSTAELRSQFLLLDALSKTRLNPNLSELLIKLLSRKNLMFKEKVLNLLLLSQPWPQVVYDHLQDFLTGDDLVVRVMVTSFLVKNRIEGEALTENLIKAIYDQRVTRDRLFSSVEEYSSLNSGTRALKGDIKKTIFEFDDFGSNVVNNEILYEGQFFYNAPDTLRTELNLLKANKPLIKIFQPDGIYEKDVQSRTFKKVFSDDVSPFNSFPLMQVIKTNTSSMIIPLGIGKSDLEEFPFAVFIGIGSFNGEEVAIYEVYVKWMRHLYLIGTSDGLVRSHQTFSLGGGGEKGFHLEDNVDKLISEEQFSNFELNPSLDEDMFSVF